MIVDEMEMVARLRDVEPLPAQVSERAKTVLRAAMTAEGDPRVIQTRHRRKRGGRPLVVRAGVAAGVAAAVAAIALVATSPGPSTKVPALSKRVATSPGHSTRAPAASNHAASPLVRLADYVSGSATPAGNAALVARTTTAGGQSVTVYDLYADAGQYFFSRTEGGLAVQVRAHHNLADGLFAREVAAAKLAATGNVRTAAQDMADAPDPSHVVSPNQTVNPAVNLAKQAAEGQPQTGSLFDNWVWENSQDALIAGAGQPQVRAGVLRILATLPDVTVTPGTLAGQPTLRLAAGTPELGFGYVEQLTINATTGVPLSFTGGAPGRTASATVSYQVSRVTTSDVAAGKF